MKTIFILLLGLAGCAQTEADLAKERAFDFSGGDELAQRASYDLNCGKGQMTATVLQRIGMFQIAASAGVRGCGRQATYMRSAGTSGAWVLNSNVQSDLAALPPPNPSAAPTAPSGG